MEVSCNDCGKRYAVKPESLSSGGGRFKCRRCGNGIEVTVDHPSRVTGTGPHPTAASPRLKAADMSGAQTNDGTIQFSMDEIRRISQITSPSTVRPSSSPPTGMAAGDDSGLVSLPPPAPDASAGPTAPAAITEPDSLAPVELASAAAHAAPSAHISTETKIYAGLAALALSLAGVVGVVAISVSQQPTAQTPAPAAAPLVAAAAQPMAPPVALAPAEPSAAPQAEAEAAAEQRPTAAAEAPEQEAQTVATTGEDTAAAQAQARVAPKKKATVRSSKSAKTSRVAKRAAPRAPRPKAKKSASFDDILAATPKQKGGAKSSGSSSIDDLLNGAVAKESPKRTRSAAPAAAAASNLPDSPNRDQTLAALNGVKAKVKRCGDSGVATAAIKVSGKTGKVSSVHVSGVDGATGACVKQAVMSARFPKFQKPNFSVKYPFKL